MLYVEVNGMIFADREFSAAVRAHENAAVFYPDKGTADRAFNYKGSE